MSEQEKNGVKIDGCDVVAAHVISRLAYKKEPEKYDKFILDDLEAIKKDDQIVLTKAFDQSEPLPLLRVVIDRNKKELFQNTNKNKSVPKFEQMLKRFSRAELSLASNGNKRKILLDERYRLYVKDVEPDCSELEKKYKKMQESAFAEINSRYESAVRLGVDNEIQIEQKKLLKQYEEQIVAHTKLLNESLGKDAVENTDKEIQNECKRLLNNKEIGLSQTEKNSYVEILRSQLSDYEQMLLLYHAMSDIGNLWIEDNGLLSKYDLIKDIPLPISLNFGLSKEEIYQMLCNEVDKYTINGNTDKKPM